MTETDFQLDSEGDEEVDHYIFRAWRRNPKTGEILWARKYGLRAWRIPVYKNKAA